MENVVPAVPWLGLGKWRELLLPKEHGSWSLALEPLAFALIAQPSVGGAWLALAVAAAFLARRPLRIAWREKRVERRRQACQALFACTSIALTALAVSVFSGGAGWLPWLLPSAVTGAIFLGFDLRNGGREEVAEVAGAAAFALLPAAMAVLAGAPTASAIALAVVMCGRAVPTVLTVRASLRQAKGTAAHAALALAAAVIAAAMGALLLRRGLIPLVAFAALVLLALRSFALLLLARGRLRARTIGMIEAVLGLVFVVSIGIAWNA